MNSKRKFKDEKTSLFKGVCQRRGKWLAQNKRAGFYQEFHSELEALAHLMAACYISGSFTEKELFALYSKNSPDKARPSLEVFSHISEEGFYRFPIDQKHHVIVDLKIYERYRGHYWFLKDGLVTCISSCQKVDGKYKFEYSTLDSIVFGSDSNQGGMNEVGLFLSRINGNYFDMRRSNISISTRRGSLPSISDVSDMVENKQQIPFIFPPKPPEG